MESNNNESDLGSLGQTLLTIVDVAPINKNKLLSAFSSGAQLKYPDYVVILTYFVCLVIVGIWSSKKSEATSASGFFLASRNMHWIPVGASLFASNIGPGHFIGLAGAGANSGISISAFEFNSMFICLVLGWFFIPVYFASGISTMPEYIQKRFGGQRIRIYLSLLSLVLYIFTKISADLYSGAIFIKHSLNIDLYTSVIILLGVSAICSIGGGLTTVMWTDFAQSILMIGGSFVLSIISLRKVGGYHKLMQDFPVKSQPTDSRFISYQCPLSQHPNVSCSSCSQVSSYYNHLIRPATDSEMPWPGVVFGLTILSIWYWCSDQVIVQRSLSAKNVSHAKAGCILAAFLKTNTFFLIILPGMAARLLWPNELGCSNPEACQTICGSKAGCSNIAYPLMILRILPTGLIGLMLSVMIAALVSSLTSIFNSASTIFTIDIYSRIRNNASDREQIIVARIFVLALVVASVLWIPVIDAYASSNFFHYIQSVTSFLAPPVCAVYVLAVFCPRVNEHGAFWALITGLIVGLLRFSTEFLYTTALCGTEDVDLKPAYLPKIHYLHFSIILFAIACLVAILVSLLTKPIDLDQLYRLTFWTKFSDKVGANLNSVHNLAGIVNDDFVPDYQTESNNNKSKVETLKNDCQETIFKDCISSSLTVTSNPNIMTDVSSVSRLRRLSEACCVVAGLKIGNYNVTTDIQIDNKQSSIDANNLCPIAINLKEVNNAHEDDPRWTTWTNFGAILVIAIASFLFGFFA